MLQLPGKVRIYLATEPCEMRRQFDGLAAVATRRDTSATVARLPDLEESDLSIPPRKHVVSIIGGAIMAGTAEHRERHPPVVR
jgi:hypothetical protein